MRHELVHRLTHFSRKHTLASLPDRGRLGRVGALARTALHAAATVALLVALPLATVLGATVLATGPAGLPAVPLLGWVGLLVVTAAAPAVARRPPAARRRS